MYDDVPSRSYLQTMAAHDFPHAPPDAIAHNRPAQRLLMLNPNLLCGS